MDVVRGDSNHESNGGNLTHVRAPVCTQQRSSDIVDWGASWPERTVWAAWFVMGYLWDDAWQPRYERHQLAR